MDCCAARDLLDQGLTPGSRSPQRAALGFHLAACAECRAYAEAQRDQMLAALLSQPPGVQQPRSAPPVSLPSPARNPPPQRSINARFSQLLWYASLMLIGVLGLGALAGAGSVAVSALHIHQNYQAMYVPPPPIAQAEPVASATAVPTLAPTATPGLTPTPSRIPAPTPSPTPAATATPTPQPTPESGGSVTILLLGSDRRPDESEPARTDSIMIARIDPQRQRIALLSLPRDLWVTIPGYGQARINAAHVWGEVYSAPGGGAALARETVSHLLGIPIDYYVYTDFAGFIGAIDSLGGVDVTVERELYDAQFPTMDYGYVEIHFLPGLQHMDGLTALTYSRIRHPDSDFARMRRQQDVLLGVLARLRGTNALDSVHQIEALSSALRGYVKTDLPEDRLIGLVWALRSIDPATIERYRLDQTMVSFGVGNDRWAEVADPGAIDTLARQLMGADAP